MSLTRSGLAIIAGLLAGLALASCHSAGTALRIDGNGAGRTFQGLGAVSAGASSRLLIDYPEPQRGEILDYLFKPRYGASLQHLKVEIGGDTNSTDGAEPSHMHTRDDLNFTRGYEWWLMEQARKRNPRIILDTLAWGAPGWIGDGKYYSEDMANYVAAFIEGAKKAHGLDIGYTGVWNEQPWDGEWIKLLRRTLDGHALSSVKIVAADLYQKEQWDIIHNLARDPQLDNAVYAIGVHYARHNGKVNTPDFAKDSHKPLWSSEDQPEFGPGDQISSREWNAGGRTLARIYNRNYVEGRMTKTEIWSPVTSYYDNLAAPHSDLMYANTPWSGHYDVQPTIWITAHTTQFTEPGWRYIDNACGELPGKGSYVTLRSPEGGDYTVVVETIDAATPQLLRFEITGGLSTGAVHVWRSNGRTMFEQHADITPEEGRFTATLDAGALYTFSTTTGQAKGTAIPPAQHAFPMPYREDFENTASGGTPRYLSDQDGAFEAGPCPLRPGRCLNQVVTMRPISWGISPNPFTYLGDPDRGDYAEKIDAMLPQDGEVALVGRIDSADFFQDGKALWPSGYVLDVKSTGAWHLLSTKFKTPVRTLTSGSAPFAVNHWHSLELIFRGANISAAVDGRTIATLTDSTHAHGMAGFGSGWHRASFDNFALEEAR